MLTRKAALALLVFLVVSGVLCSWCEADHSFIHNVSVTKASFNPTRDESISLSYELKQAVTVTVNVYDPDHGFVCGLKEHEKQEAGKYTVTWDGRDLGGIIVPDEAYYFVITASGESGEKEVYDPTITSGGEHIDVASPNVQRDGIVSYMLPRAARVRLRVGVENGPLIATPVDWKPRAAGRVVEQWNMKDSEGVVDLRNRKDWKVALVAFSLPDTSMIAYGNKQLSYRSYKLGPAKGRPTKPERSREVASARISEHWAIPRVVDRAVPIKVDILSKETVLEGNPCRVRDSVVLRVTVPDEVDRRFLESQGCEIMFFVDMLLVAEIEQAYMPCNWPWDLSNIASGEHVLTVNLASFRDQIGAASRQVIVEKQK